MSRPVLVWAHDLCSSTALEDELGLFDWRPVEAVADVRRYDARGHGAAAGGYEVPCNRWSAMVDDMLRVAGDGAFVAAGIGMGAVTALYAAVLAPRRVAALVLVLPPAGWELREPAAAIHQADADAVEQGGLAALAERWRARPESRLLPGLRALQARDVIGGDPKLVAAVLRAAAQSDLPPRDDVHMVVVPALILAAADEPDYPLATARELADLLIQPELVVARDAADVGAWPQVLADFVSEGSYAW